MEQSCFCSIQLATYIVPFLYGIPISVLRGYMCHIKYLFWYNNHMAKKPLICIYHKHSLIHTSAYLKCNSYVTNKALLLAKTFNKLHVNAKNYLVTYIYIYVPELKQTS